MLEPIAMIILNLSGKEKVLENKRGNYNINNTDKQTHEKM